MPDIADILDSIMTGASPAYRAAGQAPYELEAAKQRAKQVALQTSTIQSTLDNLQRETEERAQAPEAAARVYRAAQPQPAVSDLEGTSPGRGAARTSFDLMSRGASPEDIDLMARQRPQSFAGLGLMTPEAAQQKDIENKGRARTEGLMSQIDALDPNAEDYANQVRSLVTRMSVGAKPETALHAINQGEPSEPEGERYDLNTGMKYTTTRDSLTGKVTKRMSLMSADDQVAAHTKRLVGLAAKAEQGGLTPDETRQWTDSYRFINTVRPSQLQPGGYSVPRGPFGATPPGAAPGAPPAGIGKGAPQGAYRGVPPVTTEGEAEKVGLRNSIITELEGAAQIGDKMPELQDWQSRGGLRVRSWIQGHTPFETLSPEEQKWVTMHDRLRIMFEAGTMGLGPFRSPDMQAILAEIIGKYWTPGTGTRLRTLAQTLRAQGAATAETQAEGGRRPLSTPAPAGGPAGTPAPPAGEVPATPAAGEPTGLPDPVANKGRILRDNQTGQRLKSDGTKWVPQ